MPKTDTTEGRLDRALKAISDGDLVRAVALTQQSVDFDDADASDSKWLLQHLINEPDAFTFWSVLCSLQSGSSREAWMLLDRLHDKHAQHPPELRDLRIRWKPDVMERKLRAALSEQQSSDPPSVPLFRDYFDILQDYPFEEVLTHYWRTLQPTLSARPPEVPRRSSSSREAGPPRGLGRPTKTAASGSPALPTAARPSPRRRVDRATSFEQAGSRAPDEPQVREASSAARPRASRAEPSPGPERTARRPRAGRREALTTVRRTPHMDLKPEPEGEVKGLLSVIVYADQLAPRPGEEVDELEVQIPATENEIEIEVWVVPSNHFRVVGARVKPLRILRDNPRSNDARFQLALRPNVEDFTGAFASAYFHHDGRPCGRVRRAVAPNDLAALSRRDRGERPARAVSSGRRSNPAPRLGEGDSSPTALPTEGMGTQPEGRDILAVEPGAGLPDILVEVVSRGTDFLTKVRTKLVPGYEEGVDEIWFLDRRAAEEIVEQYFEKFMKDEKAEERRDYLIGAGKELFLGAPKSFRKLMLALDRKKPPRSLLICTEEPYVPWELMVPTSLGKPSLDWELPIGAVIPTGRWVSTESLPPVARVQLDASYLIAPTYPRPLDSSGEARILEKHFSCEPISPAALRDIDKKLENAPRGLLHFACHGSSSPNAVQQLALDGGDLDPTLLQAQKGFSKAVESAHPLIFLNACEVGRAKPGFVRTSGFAATFIHLGAGAVIAPLWQVDDALAGKAAQDFYNAVAADPNLTFAEAVSNIRRKSYEPGREKDDSFAAYTLYGDPLATRG